MSKRTDEQVHSALGLGLLVFAAGACLMCVEIIGAMAIAPYFGSTVYVWGSVLAVFMGALSLGYVLGGRVADVRPDVRVLSLLAVGAGLLVMLVPLAGAPVCGTLLRVDAGAVLNRLRPLVALLLLFFLPSMLLGMITPVAVRIASTALATVGRVVGRLYALNTLGSVVGALVSTFVLVLLFGNRAILVGCGAVLGLVGLVCLYLQRSLAVAGPPVSRRGTRRAPADSAGRVPGLRPLVFACGMVLMSLEVIGGAEIAPYFGSSVFVWGSVITVFLGALAVGYRLGGRLADRWPTMRALATVVVAAGIGILLVPILVPPLCKALLGASPGLEINVLRPLVASVVLYVVPIGLLAMVA
ncbi:MAG: fused MFS/spermidine synthase, partial [Planctomycetota bacterium]